MPTNDGVLDDTALKNFLDQDVMPEMEASPIEDSADKVEKSEQNEKPLPKVEKDDVPVKKEVDIIPDEATNSSLGSEDGDSGEETIAYQIFNSMQENLGLSFTDEELESIELTDDIETVNKLITLGAEKKSNLNFDNFFKANPDLYEAAQYKQAHGSLKGFGEKQQEFTDYNTVDLKDPVVQENLYRKSLALKGNSPEDIEDLVEIAKDKFSLDKKGLAAKEELASYEASKKAEYEESVQAKIRADEESLNNYVKEITNVIDSGKIMGVSLDSKTKAQMKDYFSKPVDSSGRTAKEIADENLTVEQEMLFEYWKMNNFKGMANTEAKKIKTLAGLVKKGQDGRPILSQEKGTPQRSQTSYQALDSDALRNFLEQ